MKRLPILILIVILAIPIISSVDAQPESTVRVHVFGPDVVAVDTRSNITVSVTGGPGELGGNFSISAYLEGTNVTGALPVKSSPYETTSTNGTFTVNLTAPITPQTVTLVINGTSTRDVDSEYTVFEYTIAVVAPIPISARIENNGNYTLSNLDVVFYIDGELLDELTVDFLDVGDSTTVTTEWLVASISPGTHEILITVDMNNDGVIIESDGDLVIKQYFYKEYGDLHPAIIILVGTVMVLAVLILIRTISRKRRGW
ncbi:MAG: hypothetical protein KAI64_05185 [Thermoplasmata archaeon]|nr:hypothetical protein [Thermoplasmata archaeon]